MACVVGLLLNILNIPPLLGIDDALSLLGQAAIPTGLLLAGSGLSFAYMRTKPLLVSGVSLYKLLIMPLIAVTICRWLGGTALSQAIVVGCTGAPSAAAAYVLARHMGGDATLMAGIVALTTTLSGLSIPFLLWFLHLG
jgi:predicted permease